ncbi:hypothetical protein B0H12DRAFT_1129221 [Mycena haematopus]|nr:hypothetical protein B0H12DRAFT_1129221 [Mycena haematopus]
MLVPVSSFSAVAFDLALRETVRRPGPLSSTPFPPPARLSFSRYQPLVFPAPPFVQPPHASSLVYRPSGSCLPRRIRHPPRPPVQAKRMGPRHVTELGLVTHETLRRR